MKNTLRKNRLGQYLPWSEFDALLEPLFRSGSPAGRRGFLVPASLWEEDSSYHVELDLPGVKRENVELTYDKGTLRIQIERVAPEQKREGWHEERLYGKAVREVTFSDNVDPGSIAAELRDGVLHVSIAKNPEAQPSQIEVK